MVLEGFEAVEVVGVDDTTRVGDEVARGKKGVGGAPRFFTVGRADVRGGEIVGGLEGVVNAEDGGEFVGDGGAEGGFEVTADDEDYTVESGAVGVEDGVVHEEFAVGTSGFELFEAAVAGAEAGG